MREKGKTRAVLAVLALGVLAGVAADLMLRVQPGPETGPRPGGGTESFSSHAADLSSSSRSSTRQRLKPPRSMPRNAVFL